MFQTKEYRDLYWKYCRLIEGEPVYYITSKISNSEHYRINISEPSDWVCHWCDIQYVPTKNNVPSWFARRMTEYFFGCKWRRK
jgi:hypothetical protein